ncbi:MAG TPA: hypothetical protein VHQ70_05080, partial [Syntrophomonadaceae bacterium]|nr:hypothetical protein [Syntrophomonadaceae bacterium]
MISNVVKQFDGSDMRTDIISSWKRSEANGLNPKQTVLPPIDSSTPTLDMFDREWQSLRDLDIGFYEVFNLFLQGNNTAVFFIDLDLNIIMQDGNELLLEQLNTINMEVGANLSETRIGTNAAALAALNKKKSYVAGSEHYLDILKDYACEASPIFIGNNIPIAYVMYVVNTKAFNRSLHMRLNEFIDMQNRLFNLASSHMELFLKQEILESGVDPKECGTIFINSYGFIIKVNAWVLAYFNIET